MQCHQIQPLLSGYASGSLPAYKAAWVAQHLAACENCQAQAVQARQNRRPAASETAATSPVSPVQAAPPAPALLRRGEVSVAIQRPVPAWFRLTAALVVAAVAAGSAWLLVARARAPVAPMRPPRRVGAQPEAEAIMQVPSRLQPPPAAWPAQVPHPVARPWYEVEAQTDLAPYWPDATVGR